MTIDCHTHILPPDIIKKKIDLGIDLFDRGYKFKKVDLDNTFPQYIVDNKAKLKEWIL